MTRMTRLLTPVNSPEVRSFVINKPHLCPNPTFGFLAGISPYSSSRTILSFRVPNKINSQISPSYKFSTSTTVPTDRREPRPQGTEMESNTASQSTESDKPAVDGFISVDNASPESKSNSNFEGIVQSNEEESGNDDGDGDGDGEGEGDDQVEVVPEEIMKSVVSLSCESTAEGGFCDVYLIGTAHVSQESCREVAALISYLKPEVVFLELCSNRVAVLTPQNLKVPTMREMVDMWKKNNNAFGILYSWFLAKVATKLEVLPGSEFRVAFEEAKKYGGKVVLGDRPVQITLRRTWGKMPLWHKTKLLYSLLFQGLFLPSSDDFNKMLKDMDDIDILTLVIQEMSKEFPTLMETLVHERDQYMSSTLLRVAKEHSSVVAVVGKGHLQGIKKYWKQPVEVNNLMQMPQPKATVSVAKIIASLGVAAAGVAIISGIYISSKK